MLCGVLLQYDKKYSGFKAASYNNILLPFQQLMCCEYDNVSVSHRLQSKLLSDCSDYGDNVLEHKLHRILNHLYFTLYFVLLLIL